MVCGVKYCGGCNPRYNRTNFFKKVVKACSEVEFQYVAQGRIYDHLLVIQGCPSKCANITEIQVNGNIFNVSEECQYEELIVKLKSL